MPGCSMIPSLIKLFDVIAPRYAERAGGYTRVIKAGIRMSDASPMAIIEFIDRDVDAKGQGFGPGNGRRRSGRLIEEHADGLAWFDACEAGTGAISFLRGVALRSPSLVVPFPTLRSRRSADHRLRTDRPVHYPASRQPSTRPTRGTANSVPDPYRWLEADVRVDARVAAWVDAENRVSHAYLDSIAGAACLCRTHGKAHGLSANGRAAKRR